MSRKTNPTTTTRTTRRTTATTRAVAAATASMFEALEDRRLFSALVVNGTGGDDLIRLTQRGHILNVSINSTARNYLTTRFDSVTVNALDGADTVMTGGIFKVPLTLNGGNGDDSLSGGRAADLFVGGDGNDTFKAGLGDDAFDGGIGSDTVSYATYRAGVTVSLDDGANDGSAGESDNVYSTVENLVGGYGSDTLTGSASANYLQGAGGTDTIHGLGGPDTLDGGIGGSAPYSRNNGHDVLWGGDGNDALHASDYGNNTMYGEGGNDVLWGYGGADKLFGASGNDWLFGGANADELFGGTGDDHADGQSGNDKIYGNAGPIRFIRPIEIAPILPGIIDGTSNTIQLGETSFGATISQTNLIRPIDTVIINPLPIDPIVLPRPLNPTLPPVDLTPRLPVRDHLQIDVLNPWLPPVFVVETDDDTLIGGIGDDRIRGDGGHDQINGGDGNDVLYGDAGNDTVHGDAGKDRAYGGAGDDLLFGDAGDDILVSVGGGQNDQVTGGDGLDSVWLDAEATELDHNDLWGAFFEGLAGTHHRVGGFQTLRTSDVDTNATLATQTPSRELNGQNLLDPIGSGSTTNFSDRPLFASDGANMDDVDQGGIGDCYFLAGLSATAKVGPNHIQQAVVDLGDGTYAVRFYRGGVEEYWRVDGDLLTNGAGNPNYAGLGRQDSLWVPILEKAFTFFRSNRGTFQSIHGGGADEPFNALKMTNYGVAKGSGGTVSQNAAQTLQNIKAELDQNRAVVAGTPSTSPPAGTPIVPWHLYTVDSVNIGASTITLRNPWATDGGGNSDGSNDGYVTITAGQFHGYFTGIWAGVN